MPDLIHHIWLKIALQGDESRKIFSLPSEHSKEKLNAVHVKINLKKNNLNFSILKTIFCIENYKYGKNTLNEVQIQIQVKMIPLCGLFHSCRVKKSIFKSFIYFALNIWKIGSNSKPIPLKCKMQPLGQRRDKV